MAFHHRLFCTLNCNSCSKIWQATIYMPSISLDPSVPMSNQRNLVLEVRKLVYVHVIQEASHNNDLKLLEKLGKNRMMSRT